MADAYLKWLEIPAHLRPPTHYQLLGIAPSELDLKAIAAAADRQLERLRTHGPGPADDEYRRIEQELIQARNTLLDPVTRQRYDQITPDATQPWWQPDEGPPPVAPIPVDGWWQPDGAEPPPPTDNAVPPTSAVETVPPEGWWQGEAPEVLTPPAETTPSFPETVNASVSSSAPEPNIETPLPPPLPPTSNNWWKKSPGESEVIEPPVVVPQQPPASVEPSVPPPARPSTEPASAPRPIVSEKALAYSTPPKQGSPILLAAFGIGILAIGAVVLIWTKPWESSAPPTDDKTVAANSKKEQPNKKDESANVGPQDPTPESIDILPRVVEAGPMETVKIDPKPMVDPKPPPPEANEFTTPVSFRGHQGGVYGVAVNRTGKTIFSVSEDQHVFHYTPKEAGKHGQIHKLVSPGVAIALRNEDRDLIFCDGGDVVVYDVPGRKVKASFENPRGGIRSLAASGDASIILTGATDGTVRWWSVATGKIAHTLDIDDKATVSAVAISSDAKFAAIGLSDGRVCIWDLKKRSEIKRWKAHAKGGVTAVSYSPDGKKLVSCSDDGSASVWHSSGTLAHKLTGHEGPIQAAVWCSDNQRVITGGIDRQVRLWDESKGWKTDWSTTAPDKVFSLAIDSRDRFVLIGQANGGILLQPLSRGPLP